MFSLFQHLPFKYSIFTHCKDAFLEYKGSEKYQRIHKFHKDPEQKLRSKNTYIVAVLYCVRFQLPSEIRHQFLGNDIFIKEIIHS